MNITLNINAYTIDSHLVCDQVNGIIYAKISANDSICATFHIPSEALTNYRMSFVLFSLTLSIVALFLLVRSFAFRIYMHWQQHANLSVSMSYSSMDIYLQPDLVCTVFLSLYAPLHIASKLKTQDCRLKCTGNSIK